MAYDYSLEFIDKHITTANQLVELMKKGGYSRVQYKDTRDARAAQYLLNNILASIAFNWPEYKDVRQRLRTWIKYEQESWSVYIGDPPEGIRGPRSKVRSSVFEPMPGSVRSETVTIKHYPDKIVNQATWMGFSLWVAGQQDDKTVREITAHFNIDVEPSMDIFDGFREIGWVVENKSPQTIKLRR